MKVFIAGATGVLGKRLVGQFTEEGYDVTGLARDEDGERIVSEHGGTSHRGDILDPSTLKEGARDADVLIHAATAIPRSTRPSEQEWEQNDRVRREGTRNLTRVAAEIDAKQYLQQSITWVACPPDGSPFDEDSKVHPDRVTQSALDGERIARNRGKTNDFRVSVLRCGWFYSGDSYHIRDLGSRLANRRIAIVGGGILGRKDATVSFIHVEDAARAFVRAVDGNAEGLWHIVDDKPTTVAEFFRKLARRLNAPEPIRIPGWLARPLIGSYNVRFLTTSKHTSNQRARKQIQWEPAYPTIEEGLDQVVSDWKEEGYLFND